MFGIGSWSSGCFMLYTASNKKDIVGKVGKPYLKREKNSCVSQYFFVCLIISLFFFLLLYLPKPPCIKCFLHGKKSWDLRKLFLRIRLMSFSPVFDSTMFSLCLQSNCCSRFCLNCLFCRSKNLYATVHKHLLIYDYAEFSTTVSSLHMFLCL